MKRDKVPNREGKQVDVFTVDCDDYEGEMIRDKCKVPQCNRDYVLHVSEDNPEGVIHHPWKGEMVKQREIDIYLPEGTLCFSCAQPSEMHNVRHHFLTKIDFLNASPKDEISVYRSNGEEVRFPYYGITRDTPDPLF